MSGSSKMSTPLALVSVLHENNTLDFSLNLTPTRASTGQHTAGSLLNGRLRIQGTALRNCTRAPVHSFWWAAKDTCFALLRRTGLLDVDARTRVAAFSLEPTRNAVLSTQLAFRRAHESGTPHALFSKLAVPVTFFVLCLFRASHPELKVFFVLFSLVALKFILCIHTSLSIIWRLQCIQSLCSTSVLAKLLLSRAL